MPVTPEQAIMTAAQLYRFRDLARELLGANYAIRMAEYGNVIKRAAAQRGITDLQMAIRIAKDDGLSEVTRLYVLAAAVELAEPSKVAA